MIGVERIEAGMSMERFGRYPDGLQTDRRMQDEDGKSRWEGYSRWGTRGNPFGIRTLNEWKSTLSKIFPAESAPVTSKWYSSGLLPLPLSYLFLWRVFRMIGVRLGWLLHGRMEGRDGERKVNWRCCNSNGGLSDSMKEETLNGWKSTFSKIFPAESAPVTSKRYSSGLTFLDSFLFFFSCLTSEWKGCDWGMRWYRWGTRVDEDPGRRMGGHGEMNRVG